MRLAAVTEYNWLVETFDVGLDSSSVWMVRDATLRGALDWVEKQIKDIGAGESVVSIVREDWE